MVDVRPTGYVNWLGMLESRLQAQGAAGPFGLPGPHQRPLTASSAGEARLTTAGVQPKRGAMGPHAEASAALTQQERPRSTTAADWGSGPVSVVHSEAQTEQLAAQQKECVRRADALQAELRDVARQRDEELSTLNADAQGSSQKARATESKYSRAIALKQKELAEQKKIYKHVTWQLERSKAAAVDWGATRTPHPSGRATGSEGPAAAWRPVGAATAAQRSESSRHIGPGSSYAPPSQRLSKLEAARQQAEEALVATQRQRAAETAQAASWLAHLDDEIYRASTQMHASFKGEYRVTLHTAPGGFGMTLDTDKHGVTRVTKVDDVGPAASARVVPGSEVLAVAGCALERGQGQSGLVPVQAVLGASAVEFRLCRPKSKQTRQDIRDFPEYAELPVGRAMMTLEYCTGHLHARYEWVAEELRQAVVERFPEVKVFLKPIDPHAPRNRKRTGAFEVQLCFHSRKTGQLEKVLLFSRLKRGEGFPATESLLAKLQELQSNPPKGGASSWDAFVPETKLRLPPQEPSFAEHGADPFDEQAYMEGDEPQAEEQSLLDPSAKYGMAVPQPVAQEPAVAENSVEGERSGDPVAGSQDGYSDGGFEADEDVDEVSG